MTDNSWMLWNNKPSPPSHPPREEIFVFSFVKDVRTLTGSLRAVDAERWEVLYRANNDLYKSQVFATRAGSRLVDWSEVDVATLKATSDREDAAAGKERDVAFSLYVTTHLKNTPAYQVAVGTVGEASSSAPPTTHPYG